MKSKTWSICQGKQERMTKGAVLTFLAEAFPTINKTDSVLYWANQVINNPDYKLVIRKYGVAVNTIKY